MKLRIVSGNFKGRWLSLPQRKVAFRPTKERVRQSLAETVKENIPGAVAADFCAGSGAFGIELISRGAAEVHFVEWDRFLAMNISNVIVSLGIASQCKVFRQDVRDFIRKPLVSYDIIFYDPPYESEDLASLVPALLPLLSKQGILLHEYSAKWRKQRHATQFPDTDGYVFETRTYGDTAADLYTRHR